jgi:hypothetical protein
MGNPVFVALHVVIFELLGYPWNINIPPGGCCDKGYFERR